MPPCVARQTLERAKFFNRQAKLVDSDNREQFRHFTEASIVFGRSVTFHLKKEFSKKEGFEKWYVKKQKEMSADPTCKFLLNKRNYILKEGPIAIERTISMVINESVVVSDYMEAEVVRGKPWYRRSPMILWNDFKEGLLQPFRKLADRIRTLRKVRSVRVLSPTAKVKDRIHFEEADFRNRPATEVISEYLECLEEIVNEAEREFSSS